jgi:hypothetical protein
MSRQSKRQPGPILRTTITPRPTASRPGQNLLLRTRTQIAPSIPIRRTRAMPMTGAQRDATGARSDWSKPMFLRPMTTPMMPAWSRTTSDFARPVSPA